jgi:hypothetical protein
MLDGVEFDAECLVSSHRNAQKLLQDRDLLSLEQGLTGWTRT